MFFFENNFNLALAKYSNPALVEKISQIEDWAFAIGIEECKFSLTLFFLKNFFFGIRMIFILILAREMSRTKDFNVLKE